MKGQRVNQRRSGQRQLEASRRRGGGSGWESWDGGSGPRGVNGGGRNCKRWLARAGGDRLASNDALLVKEVYLVLADAAALLPDGDGGGAFATAGF